MSSCRSIPADLADIPPGPRLAQALSGIELARLSGFDCVEVLKARYRQLNHDRAQVMAAMVEVGLCGPAHDDLARMPAPDEFSADEIRAALMLTRRAADTQFWLAHDLITRLPAVHAALDAGRLDEPRARVLSEWTTDLSTEQARAVCAAVLARTPTPTTGQMIEQVKKLAIAIDPAWAQRRYEHALADRKIIGRRNPDGSANLSGLNLPLDRVAAASGRIDALAKAAKRAGDPRPLDHVRADLFLGMTDGTYAGLDDATILDLLRTASGKAHDQDGQSGDGEADNDGGPDEPGDGGPDKGPDDGGPHWPGGHGPEEPGGNGPDGPGMGTADDAGNETGEDRSSAIGGPTRQPCPTGAGMELRVRLSTLLGHDEYPGELAGWGPVHAELARDLASSLTGGQWRYAITDQHGQLLHSGITPARPTGWAPRSARSRQIVELQIPATTLHDLIADPDTLGGWALVLTDLARRHRTPQPPANPARRTPGAALRREVQIRDRYCVMVGCRAPAHSADADHTVDHAYGGPTTGPNLGHGCRHDHRVKHEGGWQLHQPEPGLFRWTSRLGHTYYVRTPPIIEPLPDPLPRHQSAPPLYTPPDDDWNDSPIWDERSPKTDTKPPPRPPPDPDPDDDPPPF
ncbi:MAG: DUF222 domain-containing protein [Pseudonocardiaceae bacterium]